MSYIRAIDTKYLRALLGRGAQGQDRAALHLLLRLERRRGAGHREPEQVLGVRLAEPEGLLGPGQGAAAKETHEVRSSSN